MAQQVHLSICQGAVCMVKEANPSLIIKRFKDQEFYELVVILTHLFHYSHV